MVISFRIFGKFESFRVSMNVFAVITKVFYGDQMRILLFWGIVFMTGCFRLTAVEHTVFADMTRSHTGGESYSESPSGYQEKGGGWRLGTSLKTIWGR